MTKFTVTIPTMWKYEPFVDFLTDLTRFEAVDEIILVNNNPEATPVTDILTHPKMRLFNFGKNIGVNPAWNLGVKEAKNKKICILNDDVIFDLRAFYHVDPVLRPESGIVGICPGTADFNQPPMTTGRIRVIPWTGQHTFGFGCLMWVHQDAWITIPDGMDIYYGDNWIFDAQLIMGKTNYIVTDTLFCTPFAATCSKLGNVDERLANEGAVFNRAMQEFRENQARAKESVTNANTGATIVS